MILRFKDENDHNWMAIWQTQVRFGASVEFVPDEPIQTGIKFCNLTTGETRFLELSEEELPNAEQLEQMGDDAVLQLLGRTQ